MIDINKSQEVMIPPLGTCWIPTKLYDGKCGECKYFDGCTNKKKGQKVTVTKQGKKK